MTSDQENNTKLHSSFIVASSIKSLTHILFNIDSESAWNKDFKPMQVKINLKYQGLTVIVGDT